MGGRYEWVNFDYYEDGKYMEGQSRNFSNFFPSVSLGSEIGGVQLQLSYAAKTRRPSYQQLSNNVTYANRFTLQSGNPLLEHEVVHNVSLMGHGSLCSSVWIIMTEEMQSFTGGTNGV